jgi:hypothetical protein
VSTAPPNLDDYVRHATVFGGLRAVWETAVRDELKPVDLGRLALSLRELASRQKPGRNGHTVSVERFVLRRSETAALARRLIRAGADDSDVRRYTGASQPMVRTIRREADLDSRNTASPGGSRSAEAPKGARAPTGTLKSHAAGTCKWCKEPLPAGLRADASYCPGGAHRQAAYRAARRQLTRQAA